MMNKRLRTATSVPIDESQTKAITIPVVQVSLVATESQYTPYRTTLYDGSFQLVLHRIFQPAIYGNLCSIRMMNAEHRKKVFYMS